MVREINLFSFQQQKKKKKKSQLPLVLDHLPALSLVFFSFYICFYKPYKFTLSPIFMLSIADPLHHCGRKAYWSCLVLRHTRSFMLSMRKRL